MPHASGVLIQLLEPFRSLVGYKVCRRGEKKLFSVGGWPGYSGCSLCQFKFC